MSRISLAAIFILFFNSHLYGADPKSLVNDLSNMANSNYGSEDGFKNNIANPLQSSDTPMKTLDGSQSFSAQITCPSSKRFLEIFAVPGSSGDIATVVIGQDTNMDSVTDYSFSPPIVSGVCANGFISCNPGTWTNCKYYLWAVDQGKITINETMMSSLGGCYCINNSCGSNLVWSNLSHVLRGLGGGVSAAIQKGNPKFAISDVKIQDTIITYYGQDAENCSSIASGATVSALSGYKDNPSALSSDAQSLAGQQSQDPNSYYSLAIKSNSTQQNKCTEKRIVLDSNTEYIENDCTIYEVGCRLSEEVVDGVSTYRNSNPTGLIPLGSCRTIGGSNICRDWWVKERTYLCSGQSYDTSAAKKRERAVRESVRDNITYLYYEDCQIDSDGNCIMTSGSITLMDRDSLDNCDKACKTVKVDSDTQVGIVDRIGTSGNTSQYRNDTSSNRFAYKRCVNSICPLDTDEQMIKPCQCINDFAEAASIMQVLSNAGSDLICSDGAKK